VNALLFKKTNMESERRDIQAKEIAKVMQ